MDANSEEVDVVDVDVVDVVDVVEDVEDAEGWKAVNAAGSDPTDATGSISLALDRGSLDRGAERSMGCCNLICGATSASAMGSLSSGRG